MATGQFCENYRGGREEGAVDIALYFFSFLSLSSKFMRRATLQKFLSESNFACLCCEKNIHKKSWTLAMLVQIFFINNLQKYKNDNISFKPHKHTQAIYIYTSNTQSPWECKFICINFFCDYISTVRVHWKKNRSHYLSRNYQSFRFLSKNNSKFSTRQIC